MWTSVIANIIHNNFNLCGQHSVYCYQTLSKSLEINGVKLDRITLLTSELKVLLFCFLSVTPVKLYFNSIKLI